MRTGVLVLQISPPDQQSEEKGTVAPQKRPVNSLLPASYLHHHGVRCGAAVCCAVIAPVLLTNAAVPVTAALFKKLRRSTGSFADIVVILWSVATRVLSCSHRFALLWSGHRKYWSRLTLENGHD